MTEKWSPEAQTALKFVCDAHPDIADHVAQDELTRMMILHLSQTMLYLVAHQKFSELTSEVADLDLSGMPTEMQVEHHGLLSAMWQACETTDQLMEKCGVNSSLMLNFQLGLIAYPDKAKLREAILDTVTWLTGTAPQLRPEAVHPH